jgi:hypothetical protein
VAGLLGFAIIMRLISLLNQLQHYALKNPLISQTGPKTSAKSG